MAQKYEWINELLLFEELKLFLPLLLCVASLKFLEIIVEKVIYQNQKGTFKWLQVNIIHDEVDELKKW